MFEEVGPCDGGFGFRDGMAFFEEACDGLLRGVAGGFQCLVVVREQELSEGGDDLSGGNGSGFRSGGVCRGVCWRRFGDGGLSLLDVGFLFGGDIGVFGWGAVGSQPEGGPDEPEESGDDEGHAPAERGDDEGDDGE